ncbi:MAG: T9SS type A sorting domain-containing protein, partial [Lentimicrobium sp.]|nr:T9SS type A sorting domain-containing protein [Lentimicrobium sp.]
GTNDPFFLYPGNMDVKDSLDLYGIPYTFYSHGGGHTMPAEFTQNAFMFLDSLLMPPVIPCSCLPEGISFNTQAEIDNFQTNYPGCREIGGDVHITGVESDISNLQGLSILSEIGGLLWINTTYDLANLEGLNGIVSIGGDLVIGNASMAGSGNQILEDFSGLNNLETIGGDFSVSFNPILINFQGLSSLVTVGGDFRVGYNPSLINFEGVESLISIGEDLILGSNESMTNLTGLDNLSSIGGEIRIYGNSALNVCETEWLCAYLDSPTGAVNIHDNAAGCNSVIEVAITCGAIPCLPYGNYLINSQSDIDNFQVAFPDCEELQGNVRVSGNDITDLSGLNNVTFIGGDLWIIYNNALTSLTGLDNLTSIGGNLSISGNESLSTCDAEWLCDLLSNTGGYVNIYNNATGCSSVIEVALSCGGLPCLLHGGYGFYTQADIDNFSLAFPGCSDLEGSVGIKGNDITNLDGLNQVTSIGGNLRFYNAYELQSLMGLGNLASIGGYLEFWQNNSLTSLAGLENLISVGSYLMLWHYDALTSLTGLEGLTSIAGSLEIIFNSSLTNLTGLENIVASSISDLKISSNTSLSTCHVQSICDYLAAPNGTVTINWNAPGCNSQAQVIAACETVDIEETALESALSVYPNPLSDQMNITLALDKPNPVSLIMTNNLGQIVAFINENQYSAGTHQIFWNASKLPSGIYFLRLQIGDGVVIKKILKY